MKSYRLVSNILAPVCSPALLRSGPPLKRAADLARHTLLHSIGRPDDWSHWLRANAPGEPLDPYAGQTYQSSELAYQAALEGQGIAMAQLVLVEKDFAAKRLVSPLRKTLDMGTFTYYLLTPADRPESSQIKEFREWLLDQCSSA